MPQSSATRHLVDQYPLQAEHHDVLVLKSAHELYRAPCNKLNGEFEAEHGKLSKVGPNDEGHRKVVRIAHGESSEVCFALLPIKPEPASAAFSCYLVNSPTPSVSSELPKVRLRTPGRTVTISKDAPVKELAPQPRSDEGCKVAFAHSDGDPCYFVDATQLDFVNPWTQADWSGLHPKG